MKRLSCLVISCLLVLLISCSKKHKNEMIVENCAVISNSKILSSDEKGCIFNNVYSYKSEFYITCVCCVCNKIDMAINCDTIPLCDIQEDCMQDFYEEATYLFSVEGF